MVSELKDQMAEMTKGAVKDKDTTIVLNVDGANF